MKSKLIYQRAGERTCALVFEIDDDPIAGLLEFAGSQNPIREQVEVLTLAGDIALEEGRPKVHAHVVVGKRDGSAHGGHLKSARVRPTLEVVLVESPAHLRRRIDPKTGLALIDLSAT